MKAFVSSLALGLTAGACALDEAAPTDRDSALAEATALVAGALDDRDLQRGLVDTFADRSAVPFEELRGLHLSDGRTLQEVVAPSGVESHVPYFQISAPFGMGDRFAVTFEPSDEAAPIELHAGGAWSSVDPNELGAEPLLVLGVDERALFMSRIPSFQDPAGSTLPSAAGDKKWYLRMLEIYDDKEPAYKGDPEVFIMCYPTLSTSGYGNIVEGPLDRVNDENHEYWWNDLATQPRLNTLRPGDISRCDIMEADSDSLDDLIETVNFFYSDSNFREYDLGNAHFKVRWAVE